MNLNKSFGPMTNELLNSLIEDRKKLPENIFISNFLPVFSGEIPLEKVPDFMGMWISIAGSPSASVDIVDSSNNVIFTVPSIFDTSFIDPKKKDSGMNFSEIINFAKMHNGISPSMEKKVFIEGVQKKIDKMKTISPTYGKNLELWKAIFNRYAVGTEKPAVQQIAASQIMKTNVSDDDFE